MHFLTRDPMPRRTFLKGLGATVALPYLDAMMPAFGRFGSGAAAASAADKTRLVCIDHWGGSRDSLAERYAAELAVEDVQQTFRANMRELGIAVDVIAEPSSAAALHFEPSSVDRVFLDGSHDAASVTEDLVLWSARLCPGGILAGHDYDAKHPALCAAVVAFAEQRGLLVRRGPRSIFWLDQLPAKEIA